MNRKILLLVILVLTSCSSVKYKNEHQHYIGIRSFIAKDRYSLAYLEIMKFQEKYPNSRYICELYNFEIAVAKDRDYSERHIKDIEKRYDNKCSHLKPKIKK